MLIVIILVVMAVIFQFVVKPSSVKEGVLPEGEETITTEPVPEIISEQNNNQTTDMQTPTEDANKLAMIDTSSGLRYGIITPGTGDTVKAGDKVTVNYVGTLTDGREFDSSIKAGRPATFPIGVGQLIKGWDEGIVGMKEGEKRLLVVPGDLAYGSTPPPGSIIGPNETLIFQVELLKIEK